MSQVPVVVISLPGATERRAKIAAQLNRLGVTFAFFDAIDGRSLSTQEREALAPHDRLIFDRQLTPGEIGCAASHLTAIRRIADEPHAFVCVLEDDALLSDRLTNALDSEFCSSLHEFDVLRLVSDHSRHRFPAWEVAPSIYVAARPGFGTQGQIYSRPGATKIIEALSEIRASFDFALYHDCHVRGLRVLEARPAFVAPDVEIASGIGNRDIIPTAPRYKRKLLKYRRRLMVIRSLHYAWGVSAVLRAVATRPWGAFR